MSRAWMRSAACEGFPEEWFFPSNNSFHKAAEVCGVCPVRRQCRQYALHHRITYGMWGGLTPAERRAIHAKT